jgi:hypothetical protein
VWEKPSSSPTLPTLACATGMAYVSQRAVSKTGNDVVSLAFPVTYLPMYVDVYTKRHVFVTAIYTCRYTRPSVRNVGECHDEAMVLHRARCGTWRDLMNVRFVSRIEETRTLVTHTRLISGPSSSFFRAYVVNRVDRSLTLCCHMVSRQLMLSLHACLGHWLARYESLCYLHEYLPAPKVLVSREPGTCTSPRSDRLVVQSLAFESWYTDASSPSAVVLVVDGPAMSCHVLT